MGFLLNSLLNEPYYLGTGSSNAASAGLTHVGLGSHSYIIDWKANPAILHRSVPLLKQQQDQRDTPGEHSINPEGFWIRSGESWHRGTGQDLYDRKESDPFRFRASQGMNVWTKWGAGLLNSTDQKRGSANTNLELAVAGSFLYAIDGTALVRTADITPGTPTFTTITGTPGTAPSDIASDGFNILTAHAASGLYKTTRGAATTASHITGTVNIVSFVKNRWLAAAGRIIYDVSSLAVGAGGPLPAALFTHPNTDFAWVGFAEGNAAIYMAGFSGDKSLIYRSTIKADGTALDAPIIAGHLPDGEIVSSIYGYLGRFILIGTNKGWRLAISNDSGDLSIGQLIPTTSAVRCFEGQGEFVWFGWSDFSSLTPTATGLGRLNLGEFTDTEQLVPAYASDLMVENQLGNVLSVVTFQGLPVFAVSGAGIYAEDTMSLVESGYIDTGDISYGITDPKIALFIDAHHMGEHGEHEILISNQGGAFSSIGLHHHDSFPRALGQITGRSFELRHILYRDEMDTDMGLELRSWLLLSQPKVKSVTTNIIATIIIASEVEDNDGGSLHYIPYDELSYIATLARNKDVTTWQEADTAFSVIVEDYELSYNRLLQGAEGMTGYNGSCTIKMKVVE
jgi:hypothetical protein